MRKQNAIIESETLNDSNDGAAHNFRGHNFKY